MPTERIEFPGAYDDLLAARLERPDDPPRAFALFAHCFTCGKDVLAATRISRGLAARGIAVLRFDFTGLGHSEGDFANTSFSSNIADLVQAARWLADQHAPPQVLIGHSLGGAAVLAAATQLDSVLGVATLGAPADVRHLQHLLGDVDEQIEAAGQASVRIGPRTFPIRRQFLDDLRQHDQAARIASLRPAVLVLHAPDDEVVPIAQGLEIFRHARQPKSFIALPGADHLLSDRDDAEYVSELLCLWSDRLLTSP